MLYGAGGGDKGLGNYTRALRGYGGGHGGTRAFWDWGGDMGLEGHGRALWGLLGGCGAGGGKQGQFRVGGGVDGELGAVQRCWGVDMGLGGAHAKGHCHLPRC